MLVEDTDELEPGEEDALRAERERMRHVAELGEGATAAAQALDPDEGDGARALAATAERAVAPLERLAPELERVGSELRDLVVRLGEVASDVRRFVESLDADPGRAQAVEERLERLSDVRRRHARPRASRSCSSGATRRSPSSSPSPLATRSSRRTRRRTRPPTARYRAAADGALGGACGRRARAFAAAVARELADLGLGEGEFHVELREHEPGPAGTDEVAFLVRPNAGLPLAPVAETASGGELSRIALAIAAVAGGETIVLDEIDAGVGGVTAHSVAGVLKRLAERAQVLTITHLPQIANVADQHLRVEKVPGDPTHTRIAVLDDAERRDELERMLGGEEFVSAVTDRAPMNGAITGRARLGRRTKDLVKRLGPDDVAIVDHADIDRVSAEELAESGVRAVVNVSPSTTGRFPNPGPLELVRAGIRLIDAPGAPLFEELSDGEQVRLDGAAIWRNGTLLAEGTVLEAGALEAALAEQQSRVAHALESFAENTLLHLREEAGVLSAGIELPPLETRFRDRHALVVARGPGYKSDLRMVRPVRARVPAGARRRRRRGRRAARGRALRPT